MGGVLYDTFGLKYKSPTIGLYFFSPDFIKFISNLPYYLSIDACPLNVDDSKYKDEILKRHGEKVLCGIIDDVEIVFVHYSNIDDAVNKWNYRRNRVDLNNLIIKYNDQNLFSKEDYYEFERMLYKNKIFFTANKELKDCKDVIYLSCFEKQGFAVDDIKSSRKYFNIKKYLNLIKNE